MQIHTQELLDAYSEFFPNEQNKISDFRGLTDEANAFTRAKMDAHFTASALVIDETASHVLLVHHKKLGKWLQPGGHTEKDQNLHQAAVREAIEECGINSPASLWYGTHPFCVDIDAHLIPARENEPEHQHFDLCFILQHPISQAINLSEESNALRWFPLAEIIENDWDSSLGRKLEKLSSLKTLIFQDSNPQTQAPSFGRISEDQFQFR